MKTLTLVWSVSTALLAASVGACKCRMESKVTIVDEVVVRAMDSEVWNAVEVAVEAAGGKLVRREGQLSEPVIELNGKELEFETKPGSHFRSVRIVVSENADDGDAELQKVLRAIREEMKRRGVVVEASDPIR